MLPLHAQLILLISLVLASCNPLSNTPESVKDEDFHPGFQLPKDEQIKISPIQAHVRGGDNRTILFSLPKHIASADIELSLDGGLTFSTLGTLNVSDTSYIWNVAGDNSLFAKIKIKGLNTLGELVEEMSNTFVIDSITPAAPAVSVVDGTPTNLNPISLLVGSCSDRSHIYVSEVSAAPAENDPAWQSCSTSSSLSIGLSSGDGNKTLYLYAKDLAGNVSSGATLALTLDTLPSPAPSVSLASAATTNSNALTVSLGSCSDVHSVKVTESNTVPLATDSGWQACTTSPGAITHTLTGTAGARTIYIWSKDSAATRANVSSSASTLSLTLDQTLPVVSQVLVNNGSTYSTSHSLTVSVKATDSHAIQLRILAVDSTASCESQFTNGTWLSYAPATAGASVNYTLTTTSPDETKKICVWARDAAGNISTISGGTPEAQGVNMDTIIVDTSAPVAPTATLPEGSPTNSTTVPITITSCTDRASIYFSETSTAPTAGDSGWQTCSATASAFTATLSSSQGAKTLYFFSKDLAGNISTASTTNVTLDSTPPAAPSATLTSEAVTNTLNLTMTLASCTDVHSVKVTESNTAPLPGDSGWMTCSTTSNAITHTLAGTTQGARTVYLWSKDSAAQRANVSTTGTSVSFTLDQAPPVLVQVVNNPSSAGDSVGDAYSGTANIVVRVKATDTLSSNIKVLVISVPDTSASCESQFVDGTWQSYAPGSAGGPVNYFVTIAALDGLKKICAWAKDEAGNRSLISGATPETANVNMDTIRYEVGNIPKTTVFTVANGNDGTNDFIASEPVDIDYSVEDIEGLDQNPVSIAYSTDNIVWKDIHNNLDASVPANVVWSGGLSGNPTSHTGAETFAAPSSGLFQVRIIIKDRSGNTSIPVYSDVMNGKPWSIYAGNVDNGDGGTSMAARIKAGSGIFPLFAVSPINNDLYVIDQAVAGTVRKLDARTGLVSTFISNGATNLVDGGSIPTEGKLSTVYAIRFDSKGRLYLQSNTQGFWQFDFSTNKTRLYMGTARTESNSSATHSNVAWINGQYAFDEDDTLYFFAQCKKSENGNKTAARIMKLTQLADGSPGTVSIVAGNCQEGAPTGAGTDALNTAFGTTYDTDGSATIPSAPKIVVWGRGKYIFYAYTGGGTFAKILDGKWYPSNAGNSTSYSYHYSHITQKFYAGRTALSEIIPNLTGSNGDTINVLVSSSGSTYAGTGTCNDDNVSPSDACVRSTSNGFDVTSSGTLLFADGAGNGVSGTFRIRYIDPTSQKIKTLLGSKPFFGETLSKNLIRGDISGIHYKSTSTTGFPKGLYFLDKSAVIMGRIDVTTQETSIVFGDQTYRSVNLAEGQTVSPSKTLGTPSSQGDAYGLAFDRHNQPWLRLNGMLYSVSSNHTVTRRMYGSLSWGMAANGDDPKNFSVSNHGTRNNLTLSADGVFILGVATSTSNPALYNNKASIRHFDFVDSNKTFRVMGDNALTSSPADETVTPGLVKDIQVRCSYATSTINCFSYYDHVSDTLYFTENTAQKIRYITHATDTSQSKLYTITLAQPVANFTFRPDGSELYYLSNGKLFCKKLGTTGTCNETDLGPNPFIGTIANGANQFTWLDNNTVLISTYNGLILKYQVTP